jgi:hypothetical protein
MSKETEVPTCTSKQTLSQLVYNSCDVVFDRECKNLIGKILTIADATFSDPIQRKAFKDVLEEKLHDHLANFRQISYGLYKELYNILDNENDETAFGKCEPNSLTLDKSALDYKYTRTEK